MANDTIVALATAPGEAALSVVRLSGPDALAMAALHFRGARSPESSPGHRLLLGAFLAADRSTPLDTVLLSVFRAPRSYTGEDVVEISCHGGWAIPRAILESLVAAGARPAAPGEFTRRAYQNGKLDLAQAEAVAALVKARSERAARAALATLDGALSRRVAAMEATLVGLLAEVEARIDFPAEVDEPIDGRRLASEVDAVAAPIRDLVDRIPSARRRETGLRVALIGRPNVGKSSLLNALLGYDRAIVSPAPGTTRDTVEESMWLDGLELRLTDTAGCRGSDDPLERLGVGRAERAARGADLAVLVLDRSSPIEEGDRAAAALAEDRPLIVAWNKSDLPRAGRPVLSPSPPRVVAEVETVAVRPEGARGLLDAMREAIPAVLDLHAGDELPAVSVRQESLLLEALGALARAARGLRDDDSYDLIASDLTDARRALAEILGRGVDDQLASALFAGFCIGK